MSRSCGRRPASGVARAETGRHSRSPNPAGPERMEVSCPGVPRRRGQKRRFLNLRLGSQESEDGERADQREVEHGGVVVPGGEFGANPHRAHRVYDKHGHHGGHKPHAKKNETEDRPKSQIDGYIDEWMCRVLQASADERHENGGDADGEPVVAEQCADSADQKEDNDADLQRATDGVSEMVEHGTYTVQEREFRGDRGIAGGGKPVIPPEKPEANGHTDDDPNQDMRRETGITDLSGHKPVPGDERVGPTGADHRLEGNVEEPQDTA